MISVILPVYNGQSSLRDAIKSVCHQEEANFELIVIDDGSTDKSVQIVQQFADKYPIAFVQNETNLGLFQTLNKGIQLAKGSFIKLWAQDDIMMPTCLREFEKAAMQHPEASFVWCQSTAITTGDRLEELTWRPPEGPVEFEPWSLEKCLQHFFYCGNLHGNISLLGFRKSIVNQVHEFGAFTYSGDIEFTVRALTHGTPLCIPEELVWLRNHPLQLSKSLDHLHFECKETMQVFRMLKRENHALFEKNIVLRRFATRCLQERIALYHLANARTLLLRGKVCSSMTVVWTIIGNISPLGILHSLLRRASSKPPVALNDFSPLA